jgi:hypothetical protein
MIDYWCLNISELYLMTSGYTLLGKTQVPHWKDIRPEKSLQIMTPFTLQANFVMMS